MAKLSAVEGIGEIYAAKLQSYGIRSTAGLLKAGATPTGRQKLAETTAISPALILEWVNHADLFRITGIGEEFADLLEEAGVDTVPELAQRKADNLYARLKEINAMKDLVRHLPGKEQVAAWIEQAKALPRAIEY